ncbi:RecF/RecN/SMC N terminal domain-domain-containing protein [Syncephalastrum racemosum]|uniref:RecF/RecN/SMC N terminal domain-domain-containing protein n=1 Tax=Syncephalastrum racemosum TaxID=13706 RepID=A0A1X2HQ49_SYNRA|nr:RecF/RecN/SMC N terminal domain-domain-containing protein [Syncephalastrum racemosum]
MYLEELIIEGFKSYVSRTHITGWDPEFNAITGLNGSGKSNVLDAICFVLGITNLSQVRASNLQDLIYKRGQAGVTKASVTIVFNNENREKSPVGFEAVRQITVTRQVLMGGRTKYIVNGHNSQQQTVQNLFQSVQLNINNPHFLIMQGRITKVLNMKPAEVLSMVEEAAGTKMFEDRKNKAFVTMAKKDRKLDEISSILRDDIAPRLDQLRAEKRAYLDFQKIESEMERLNRLVIAYEYHRHQRKLNRSSADNDARIARVQELREAVQVLSSELARIEQDKKEALEKAKEHSGTNGTYKQLEKKTNDYATQLIRLKTKRDLQRASTTDEQKSLSSLATNKGERATYNKINEEYIEFKKAYDDKTEEMEKTSELLQTLTTGISAEEGHENGYMEQLQMSKNAESGASTAEERAKLKIGHMQRELQEKEPKSIQAKKHDEGLLRELDNKRQQVESLQRELNALNWNPDHETELRTRKNTLRDKLGELSDVSHLTLEGIAA